MYTGTTVDKVITQLDKVCQRIFSTVNNPTEVQGTSFAKSVCIYLKGSVTIARRRLHQTIQNMLARRVPLKFGGN